MTPAGVCVCVCARVCVCACVCVVFFPPNLIWWFPSILVFPSLLVYWVVVNPYNVTANIKVVMSTFVYYGYI